MAGEENEGLGCETLLNIVFFNDLLIMAGLGPREEGGEGGRETFPPEGSNTPDRVGGLSRVLLIKRVLAQKKPRRPKWNPGGLNGAQEAQTEPRRPKWSPPREK